METRSELATTTHARRPAPTTAMVPAPHPDTVVVRPADHELVGILHLATVAMVARGDAPDLSARQLGVLLSVSQQAGDHTVRSLAAALNVSKPAITRALDRLEELEMARRRTDQRDRRSVLISVLPKGRTHLARWEMALIAARKAGRA